MEVPALYRLHVRPAGNPAAAFQYCLDNEVLGTGWGTHWGKLEPPVDWPDYLRLARKIWADGKFSPVRHLHDAKIGSLIWTRDPNGIYYLAKLTGEWQYRASPLNETLDLSNVRPAKIVPIAGAEAAVPGAVVRAFSGPGQAFRRVPGEGPALYSASLFAQLTHAPLPDWRPDIQDVLDSLMGPFDVQDLVAAYLQVERGFIALPARHSDSKIAYEYILRQPKDGHIVAVQVKTGDAEIDTSQLPNTEGLRWIIFSNRRRYPSKLPSHVEAVEPEDLIRFLHGQPNALPPVANFWLSLIR